MFEKARRSQRRTKGKKSGTIRKETDKNPGSRVSVDQLESSQSGLFPQLAGKLARAHILAAQVMVDHFRGLTYVHLMRSTSQREKLAGKE